MRNRSKLALWLLLSGIVIGTAVLPVSAGFYHPRGLMMSTYPQTILAIWSAQDLSQQLIVIIEPIWYFVPDVSSFQTVTLTVTLTPTGLLTGPTDYLGPAKVPMQLVGGSNTNGGSTVTFQWTSVAMSDDGYGGVEGGYLLCTITFAIDSYTATGFYRLYLSAQATAGDVVFAGWDQIGVSLRPPGYGSLYGGGSED
jgi:hypothetical protein